MVGAVVLELIIRNLAFLAAVATFLPLIRWDSWLIRAWDFPRLQLFALGIVLFFALIFFNFDGKARLLDQVVLVLLCAALLALAWWIRPFTRLHSKEVLDAKGESAIRIIVSNVLMTNRESGVLKRFVRELKPDLFVALETDQWWVDQLGELADDYPHAVEVPQDNTYGMIVRSRLPLIDVSIERLVREDIPSIHCDLRMRNGRLVHLHALHPKPPFPDEDTSTCDRDAELLIVGRATEENDGPTIVLGDLNDVAWSRTTRLFKKTSRLLDPRVGRGHFNTFDANKWWMRWPLDHVFISDHFRLRRIKRLAHINSDHFPMFVDFSFEPEGQDEQEAPLQDEGDREEADEKIEKAKGC